MASRGIINVVLIAVLVVMMSGGATAQSGCTQAIIGMSSCLNYITGNSSSPSSSCCSQLGNVVQSQPQCLCSVLNGGGAAALGITINQTLALALPGACNLQTPPVSQCNAGSGPTTSAATPATSPVGTPSDDTPDIPTTPSESDVPSVSGSGSGSKTVPSTDGSSSDGSNIKVPVHLVVSILFVLSCASAVTSF